MCDVTEAADEAHLLSAARVVRSSSVQSEITAAESAGVQQTEYVHMRALSQLPNVQAHTRTRACTHTGIQAQTAKTRKHVHAHGQVHACMHTYTFSQFLWMADEGS